MISQGGGEAGIECGGIGAAQKGHRLSSAGGKEEVKSRKTKCRRGVDDEMSG